MRSVADSEGAKQSGGRGKRYGLKKREEMQRKVWGTKPEKVAALLAEKIGLEPEVHGGNGHGCVCRRDCVSTREKNRKNGGRKTEKPESRAEAEQVKQEGVDGEIVREFLLESQIEFKPAGKYAGWSGPGHRGDEFCAGASGEPGVAECDGAGAGIANAAGLPEVNFHTKFRKLWAWANSVFSN